MTAMNLSVIGLGKLGACTLACFAEKGHNVVGVDLNRDYVDKINSGNAPVAEARLDELLSRNRKRIFATMDFSEAIEKSDVSFLIVPTPSLPDGHFTDRFLKDALAGLSAALRKSRKKRHLFVVTSTVSPGTTENSLIPLVAEASGRKPDKGFGFCYNPEFIALGSVIRDFLNPDMVLIGERDREDGDLLEAIYKQTCESRPRISRMSLVSAEITKIALNSYVTMKISYANTLANICEEVAGADLDAITSAIGADRRVSPYYLKGGLAFGGPCFPRDNRAFIAFADRFGLDLKLQKATDAINHYQVERLTSHVIQIIEKNGIQRISVAGMAYKPDTPVIEEAMGVALVKSILAQKDVEIMVFDPLASDNVKSVFGEDVICAASLRDCLKHSSLCILANPSKEYSSIGESDIVNNPTWLIDCWRTLDPSRLGGKVRYLAVGRHGIEQKV